MLTALAMDRMDLSVIVTTHDHHAQSRRYVTAVACLVVCPLHICPLIRTHVHSIDRRRICYVALDGYHASLHCVALDYSKRRIEFDANVECDRGCLRNMYNHSVTRVICVFLS